jgi:hypothetical protein
MNLKATIQSIFPTGFVIRKKDCKVTGTTAENFIKAYTLCVEHYQIEALACVLKEFPEVAIEMKRSGIYVVIIFSSK